MRFISPTILKEYFTCPRFFNFKRIQNMTLLPSEFSIVQKKIQERIDNFTFSFFSVISSGWNKLSTEPTFTYLDCLLRSKFYSHLDLHSDHEQKILQKIDEAVFYFLLWLTHFLWNDLVKQDQKQTLFSPIMINESIMDPELGLHGCPSAIFRHPDSSVSILVQYYNNTLLHLKNFDKIQAALYERVFNSLDLNVKTFISINYYNLTITFDKTNYENFNYLDSILEEFKTCIEEKTFDPPPNPPCGVCEFQLICQT